MSEETNKSRPAEQAGDDRARGGFQRDKDTSEGFRKGKRRRKVSYLTINKIDSVDYKEVNILRRFLNDRGKIIPSRQSGNTARQQRMISLAIHRAREMALLPFAVTEMTADRREYRGERRYPRENRHENAAPAAATTEAPAAVVEATAAPVEAKPKAEKKPKAEPKVEAPVVETPAAETPAAE